MRSVGGGFVGVWWAGIGGILGFGGAAGGFDCVVAFAGVCGFLPNLG